MKYRETRFYARADEGLGSAADEALARRDRKDAGPAGVVRDPAGSRGFYAIASEGRSAKNGENQGENENFPLPLRFSGRSPEPLGRIFVPQRASSVVEIKRSVGGASQDALSRTERLEGLEKSESVGMLRKQGKLGKSPRVSGVLGNSPNNLKGGPKSQKIRKSPQNSPKNTKKSKLESAHRPRIADAPSMSTQTSETREIRSKVLSETRDGRRAASSEIRKTARAKGTTTSGMNSRAVSESALRASGRAKAAFAGRGAQGAVSGIRNS